MSVENDLGTELINLHLDVVRARNARQEAYAALDDPIPGLVTELDIRRGQIDSLDDAKLSSIGRMSLDSYFQKETVKSLKSREQETIQLLSDFIMCNVGVPVHVRQIIDSDVPMISVDGKKSVSEIYGYLSHASALYPHELLSIRQKTLFGHRHSYKEARAEVTRGSVPIPRVAVTFL